MRMISLADNRIPNLNPHAASFIPISIQNQVILLVASGNTRYKTGMSNAFFRTKQQIYINVMFHQHITLIRILVRKLRHGSTDQTKRIRLTDWFRLAEFFCESKRFIIIISALNPTVPDFTPRAVTSQR